MNTMILNDNKKLNIWIWLIMSNIQYLFWLLVTCFDPDEYYVQNVWSHVDVYEKDY